MNKKKFFVPIMIIFMGIGLFGQEGIGKYEDGNDWLKYSEGMKTGFIMGLSEGATATSNLAVGFIALITKGAEESQKLQSKLTDRFYKLKESIYGVNVYEAQRGQIISGVDELYKDYANLHIPIFAIATLVAKRIKGEINEENVGEYLKELRAAKFLY
jgi:hypothetical protein